MTLNSPGDWRRRDPRLVENLGISYGSSTFSVTSASGSALSGTRNTAFVTLPSASTPGVLVPVRVTSDQTFIDDSGASTIVGNLFGFASGDTMTGLDVPFFIYACMNDADDEVAFSISRTPAMDLVPNISYIGKTGSANADRSYSHFFLGDPTLAEYDENPCQMIGSFRMRLTTSGGDWTVQALSNVDGIGRFQERRRFELAEGVKGAEAGSFFELNGGTTDPVWADQFYAYTIMPHDGLCEIYVQLANADTDGVGAVDGRIITPFCHANYQGMSGNGGIAKKGADIILIQISEDPTSENIRFITAGNNSTALYDLADFTPSTENLTVKALFPILQEA